jgi:uncharacterized protein YggE
MKTSLSIVLFACFLLTSCCFNQSPPAPHLHRITVFGTATINVAPDQMYWTVQISFNAGTLAAAKKLHDASLDSTLSYIKSLGSATKDLQTGGIRFDKQTYFESKADRSKPFSCSTQLAFTLTDFDQYGPICDELAKISGLQVQSIEYAYSKQGEVRRDALKKALLNAHDKAGDLAVTANCSLGAPLEIIEAYGSGPTSLLSNSVAAGDITTPAPGTPATVAGQIAITSSVTTTYDLTPK